MGALLEAGLQILNFLLLISQLESLIRKPLELGGGVSIHDTNVVNTVLIFLPEVQYKKVYLLLIIL